MIRLAFLGSASVYQAKDGFDVNATLFAEGMRPAAGPGCLPRQPRPREHD